MNRALIFLPLCLFVLGCSPRIVDLRPSPRAAQQVDLSNRIAASEHKVRTEVRYLSDAELDAAFAMPGQKGKTANPFLRLPPQAPRRFIVFRLAVRNESEHDVFVDPAKIFLKDETGKVFRPVSKEDLVNYWIGRVTIELGRPVAWSAQMEALKRRNEKGRSVSETLFSLEPIPPYGERSGHLAFVDDAGTLERANRPDPPDILGYAALGGRGFAWGGPIGASVGAIVGGVKDSEKGGAYGGGAGGALGGLITGAGGGLVGALAGGLAGNATGAIVGQSVARTAGDSAGGIVGGAAGGAVGGFVGGTVGGLWKVLARKQTEERRLQLYVEVATRSSRYGNPLRMSVHEFTFDKVIVPVRPAGDEELDPWRPQGQDADAGEDRP